jgi:acetoin utilization protein AcuA
VGRCRSGSMADDAGSRCTEYDMTEVVQHPEMGRTGPAGNGTTPLGGTSDQKEAAEFADRCTPEFLQALAPAPGIGAFSRYSPQAADRQHAALIKVASLAHGRVLVAHRGRHLVAYLTFHPPEDESRWASLPPGKILELGGIEVARSFRGMGLARRLMDQAFASPDFDDVIVYAQALTWCWDLEGTGMSMADYREMMLRLFGAYGFESYATDEPNIRYHRASILLARKGPKTPSALAEGFQALLIKGGEG